MALLNAKDVFLNNVNNIEKTITSSNINKSMRAFVPGFKDKSAKSRTGADVGSIYGIPTETLRKMYRYNVVVRGAVDTIIKEVISTDYTISLKKHIKENKKDNEDKQKILSFFENCNENEESLRDVLEKALLDLLIFDNCTIEKSREDTDGALKEIWAVDSAQMRINSDEHGVINGYWQDLGEQGRAPQEFKKNDIIYFSLTPRTNSLYGISKLETIHNLVTAFLYSELHNLKFFENNTIGKGILYLQNQMSETQLDRLREYWRAENTGNPHKFMIIDGAFGDVKWLSMQQSPKDMELMNYVNWLTKMIFFAFGVRPSEAGFTDDLRGAPAMGQLIQSQAFKSNTLYPILRKIENIITKHIISKEFKNNNLEFKYIEEKSLDELLKKAQVDNINIQAGLRTPDEIRRNDGLSPIEKPQQNEGDINGQPQIPFDQIQPQLIQSQNEDQMSQYNQNVPLKKENRNNEFKNFINMLKNAKKKTKDETTLAFIKLVETITDTAGLMRESNKDNESFSRLQTHIGDYIGMSDDNVKIGNRTIPVNEIKNLFDKLKSNIALYTLNEKINNIS